MIEAVGLSKSYDTGPSRVDALCGVSFRIERGEYVAIMGPSGSGKSTLMNLIGLLDSPTAGTYRLDGQSVEDFSDDRLAELRCRRIGFVFQSFHLLPRFSAAKNVELPLAYMGLPRGERRARAVAALASVELGARVDHRPNELSGGERQRVAIARSLVNRPDLLLADEPTGNLDSRSGEEICRLFGRLNRELGVTVVLVTHDRGVAEHTRRILHIRDGALVRDEPLGAPPEGTVVVLPPPPPAPPPLPAGGCVT
ncbi:MAG: ABC transporter ATP-binding protein [Planctomycetes bacterium]|nr:ABC transporter ATP-binding protein [Planctomycetota bacterium]